MTYISVAPTIKSTMNPLKKKDWTGLRVKHLTVLREIAPLRPGNTRWLVRCDCGAEKELISGELTRKMRLGTGMCQAWCPVGGTAIRNAVEKHRGVHLAEYRVWARMKSRCYAKRNASYARYGERGITVCKEWRKDFNKFLADMGSMPAPGMSVDRIDGNKGYSPDNCRWATPKEQANNRNTNVFIETPWGRMTISEAADKSGLPYDILRTRVSKGQKHKDLFRPVRKQNEKFQTEWGELTIKEACAKTGLSPKIAWSRLERGITDPKVLFTTKDLRKEKP